jgi:hypothetical protein
MTMDNETLGPQLDTIGHLLAATFQGDGSDGVFLYAEVGDNWQETSIFKDIGNQVIYRFPSEELCDALQSLWHLTAKDKKWTSISFAITDGKFDARFSYPDGIDPEESSFERSERMLVDRYGDKPIDYSEPHGPDGKPNEVESRHDAT